MALTTVFIAMNSEEIILDLTVFCLLLYHSIGALFTNMTQPVWERRVTLLETCDASTYAVLIPARPLGGGMLNEYSSSVSL